TSFIRLEKDLYDAGYYDNDISSGFSFLSPVVELLRSSQAEAQTQAQLEQLMQHDVRIDLDRYFYRPQTRQQYAFDLSTGGTYSHHMFTAGLDKGQSYRVGDSDGRFTIGTDNTIFPVKGLSLSLGWKSAVHQQATNSPIPDFNSGSGKQNTLYPYAKLVDNEGSPLTIAYRYAPTFVESLEGKLPFDMRYSPLAELDLLDNTTRINNHRYNAAIGYRTHGFSFDAMYLGERQLNKRQNHFDEKTFYSRNTVYQFASGLETEAPSYNVPLGGVLQNYNTEMVSNRGRLQAAYNGNLNKYFQLDIITGAEISDINYESNSSTRYGYNAETQTHQYVNPTAFFMINPNGQYSKIPFLLGLSKSTDRYLSYYFNGAASHLEKLTLSISARIDQSNLFGVSTNNKMVPLYSLGMLWDLHKEPLFSQISWLSALRLRTSYGYNGNIDKNVTGVLTTRFMDGFANAYSGDSYAVVANPGNRNLRWEKTRTVNVGLEFGLWTDRLNGKIEYYDKRGSDLIGDSPLAPSTGLTTYRGNTADIKGKGWDITLSGRIMDRTDWRWDSHIIWSANRDEVVDYKVPQTVTS